ncbi:YeeE/YedE family protein [Pseudomassariella vexata]|uniref:YeeE/YedE family protein n=1 Tax=Pseudomassariella vexata TaxID=1141098 RepID=A0A1Y2DVE8_9PEZI|nr:YeeE/YedE family protein [Pseudomassariella vexata]ORY63251.1 YeeE/YedE family protein [Pseudomassariella vexata]
MDTLICGAAFGSALTAAGVHQPYVIISQLTLDNFHMVESFLAAGATSLIAVTALQRLGYVKLKPRCYSTIGLFGSMDGNVIGGLTLGAGMALSASCPGSVFAQVGAGVRSGVFTLTGALIGGIFWTGILRPICQRGRPPVTNKVNVKDLTIHKQLQWSENGTILALEAMFAAIIGVAVLASSPKSHGLVHPVIGGLLIGGAQLLSAVTRKTLLGTSTAFEEVGEHFWWLTRGGNLAQRPQTTNMVFTSGMVLGALALTLTVPSAKGISDLPVNPLRATLGGFLLALGSRMAGGCTSGHGISGLSLLSLSSFVSVGAMFTGAIGVAMVLA